MKAMTTVDLDGDDDVVDARRFRHAEHQQRRSRRAMPISAGRFTMPVRDHVTRACRDLHARRSCQRSGYVQPEIVQQADDVARPADRDGRGREAVFEHQQHAHDPGDELAHRRVGIGIGRAGDRDRRGEFGVAERDEARRAAPVMTKEIMMPGPANSAAARPVSTKMPVPMMQPMPSETRLSGAERAS